MQELKENEKILNGTNRIALDAASFEANGKTYHIEQGLTIERYCEFQILEKELGFGVSFDTLMKKLKQVYKMLDKVELANSAVMIHEMISGLSKLHEREPVVLKICALFFNETSEDRKEWNNDLIVKKIDDWKKEGLDIRDFFTHALRSVNGLAPAYNELFQTISEKQQAGA